MLIENNVGKFVRFECLCPDGFELEKNDRTCKKMGDINNNHVYVQVNNKDKK